MAKLAELQKFDTVIVIKSKDFHHVYANGEYKESYRLDAFESVVFWVGVVLGVFAGFIIVGICSSRY